MLNEYHTSRELTPLTLGVIVQYDQYGNPNACILDEDNEYPVIDPPTKVIDEACSYFGSSLRGRQDGTRNICGVTHKAPISIDPLSGMYFFPTFSPTSSKCSWIAHSHIEQVNKWEGQYAEIIFKKGRRVVLEASYGSVLNQIQRTAQFRFLLDNRIKYLLKHSPEQVAEPFA
ncbi:MAG TPA: competence protein ComK [Virgibacillus sp.]|nr:competence protein ComK [Virgibacillus sp.]